MLKFDWRNDAEMRRQNAKTGNFCILCPEAVEKMFGRETVVIAENDHEGYLGCMADGKDYYLGQKIPVKFIKNKPHGNRN